MSKAEQYRNLSDETLFAKWQKEQDQLAAKVLHDRYYKPGRAYAMSFGCGNWELTKDITQESLSKVFGTTTAVAKFGSYFFETIKNTIISEKRKVDRRKRNGLPLPLEDLGEEPNNDMEIADMLSKLDLVLTEEQKKDLDLARGGLGYAEIAEQNGKSSTRVRGSLERARKAIEKIRANFW